MADEPRKKPRLPEAESHDLAALADYAEGAIVSRTLMENPSGTVTLFAFDAAQGLSEHSTPYDAMVQVLEGRADWTIGGKAVPVGAGEVVILPGGVPHGVRAPERFKMLLTMLKTKRAE